MSGITILYYWLFLCFLLYMFICKQINDFQFSYIQGRNNFVLVCIDLVLSHEAKNSRSTNMSTSVDVTEVLYRRQHFFNHLFVDQVSFNFWPHFWVIASENGCLFHKFSLILFCKITFFLMWTFPIWVQFKVCDWMPLCETSKASINFVDVGSQILIVALSYLPVTYY
jgi:hypothetical protein